MADQPVIGQFEIVHRLGGGGMAEIFLARSRQESGLPPLVAIKRIQKELADDDDFATMLIDEARLVARLAHPGIAQMYDLGRTRGVLFLVMEFVAGKDLSGLIKALIKAELRIDPPLAAWIVARALEALGHAHAAVDEHGQPLELVHRDVSPNNVLVSYDGDVKLIDFGVAKATRRLTRTATGVLKGKFRYMSPEQATGDAVDGRSDIFAAGIVLYELVAARRLYAGTGDNSDVAILRRLAAGKIPSVREPRVIPDALLPILERALARKPGDRYRTAEEFAQALDRYARQEGLRDGKLLLSGLLQDLFADEHAQVQQLRKQLVAGGTGSAPRRTPQADGDRTVGKSTMPTEQVRLDELATQQMRLEDIAALQAGLAHDGAEPPTLTDDDVPFDEVTITEARQPAPAHPARIRGTRPASTPLPPSAARPAPRPTKTIALAAGAALLVVLLIAVMAFALRSKKAPTTPVVVDVVAPPPPVVEVQVPAPRVERKPPARKQVVQVPSDGAR